MLIVFVLITLYSSQSMLPPSVRTHPFANMMKSTCWIEW